VTPLADIQFETIDNVVVARLEGEVDMSNADDLGAAITARVSSEAQALVLDLAAVAYLDSAGIHVLFDLRERLTRRGQQIRLVLGPDSPISTALEYAGVQRTLGASETVPAALAELEA
jgi:anti-sigma B factor antagonist